jgi:hypothetical protein
MYEAFSAVFLPPSSSIHVIELAEDIKRQLQQG